MIDYAVEIKKYFIFWDTLTMVILFFPSQTVKQFSEERAIFIYFLSVLCIFEKFLKIFEIRIQYQEAVQGGS